METPESISGWKRDPEDANPGETKIQKLHAGYILRVYAGRSILLTAQQLLDIMNWSLAHAEQLWREAEQVKQQAEEGRK